MKVLGFAFYVLEVCLAGIGSMVWSSQIEIKWDSRLQFIFFIQNPFSWCQKDSIFKLPLLAVGTRFVKRGTGVKLDDLYLWVQNFLTKALLLLFICGSRIVLYLLLLFIGGSRIVLYLLLLLLLLYICGSRIPIKLKGLFGKV